MAKGYFIRKGNKTSCGGEVLDTDPRIMMFGFAHARAGDPVSCGKNDETYKIVGGISSFDSHGRLAAGSLDSNSLTANLADINQRMPFVLRAAEQFDDLLRSNQRELIEQSIRDIAWGGGVR